MITMYSVQVWLLEDVSGYRLGAKNLSDRELPRTVHTIEYGYKTRASSETLSELVERVYVDWEHHDGPFKKPLTLSRSPIVGDYIELTECVSDKPTSFLYRIDETGFSLVTISKRMS
jgi:hypothetical protein